MISKQLSAAGHDLRPLLFDGSEWYQSLEPPTDNAASAWFMSKQPGNWAAEVLSVAARFAAQHDLLEHYRGCFQGIRFQDLLPERAKANRRSVTSPIWVIAHELIVAAYLQNVLGWIYVLHEPPGYKTTRGDWEFVTPAGRHVFVEVKTAEEPDVVETAGVFSRGVKSKQLREIIRGAYKQLPDDGRANLLVIVGREMLEISHGIELGDLYQTLFGEYQIRFRPFEDDPKFRGGPSMRDMQIHGTKHRRIGCIAGMHLYGSDFPRIGFYVIDNPFAYKGTRLDRRAFHNAIGLHFDDSGQGRFGKGLSLGEVWDVFSRDISGPTG